MGDTSSPCWQCSDRSGCCSCPESPKHRLAPCPACSGEGCSEYARLTDADYRCDGSGRVTVEKREQIIRKSGTRFPARGRVDVAAQQGGFERPPEGLNTKQCPVCGGETRRGHGLMGGGYGPYVVCASSDDCYWFYKEQEEPEQPAPHPDAVPDSMYSVIVRYVPVANGGPRHDFITTCDRCGTESPIKNGDGSWSTIHGSDHRSRAFVAWMVRHRTEGCKR